MVVEHQTNPGFDDNLGQMPILLENPTTEIRYIVGSQVSDLNLQSKENEKDEYHGDGSQDSVNIGNNELNQPDFLDDMLNQSHPLLTSSPQKVLGTQRTENSSFSMDNQVFELNEQPPSLENRTAKCNDD